MPALKENQNKGQTGSQNAGEIKSLRRRAKMLQCTLAHPHLLTQEERDNLRSELSEVQFQVDKLQAGAPRSNYQLLSAKYVSPYSRVLHYYLNGGLNVYILSDEDNNWMGAKTALGQPWRDLPAGANTLRHVCAFLMPLTDWALFFTGRRSIANC